MSSIRSNPSDRFPPYNGSPLTFSGFSTLRKSDMRPSHQAELTGATVGSTIRNGGGGGSGKQSASRVMSHATQPSSPHETEAMRQAILSLVNIWLSRMSLMSGITTFFAGIDSQLLSYAAASVVTNSSAEVWHRIAVTSMAGAMILHWMAAIISYLACFALYRFELSDASTEEKISGFPGYQANFNRHTNPTLASPHVDANYISVTRLHPFSFSARRTGMQSANIESQGTHGIPKLPMDLTAVNSACVGITLVGFVLAILGILAYMWVFLPGYVSIFSTVCLSASALVGLWVLG
ncbi:hypothetical protein DACRYDRAFT_107509 [Dacryopinax primogenitus]|uniref:Transmembrane protein n=1 Tax=Dacryopinax primogenitus (strain DJM 731) TaxID=1858805 RepID=M5G7E8_DACPD|nr:uncharacterized protein DACRYDRAFT_107509 [Dacryopinax primogenitus]EJU01772.1 hypothetical protein DACRYDRAFT_107509 [Dacryopinax primogenitus]